MPSQPRVGDLELDQDLVYLRREWKLMRVGWVVLALAVVAALLGLFGGGPLSDRSVADPDAALLVEYQRFVRYGSLETVRVHVAADATPRKELRLWLGQDYLDRVLVKQVSPHPDRVEAGAGRQVFVFHVADVGRPATVTFHLEPEKAGRLQGRVGLDGGPQVEFGQFAYR
jgi:hypothetical protein